MIGDKVKDFLMQKSKDSKILLFGFGILGIVTFYLKYSVKDNQLNSSIRLSKENISLPPEQVEESALDTFIPKGFVLIPLEFSNVDSLSSLVGSTAIVDLYQTSLEPQGAKRKGQKIATQVKLLRAPKNPGQFAILVPESSSDKIMSYPGPFWAAIQNREQTQMSLTSQDTPQKQGPTKQVTISYQ